MYFKNDGEYTSIVEINGFKFKKIVMKEDSRVTVEVLDMDLNTVSFISVYDSSEIEDAEEVILADVYNYIEIMTIDQIKQAWMQSPMIKDEATLNRSKTHSNFKDEMAKKTVINRAAKRYINSSTDEGLLQFAKESEQRQRKIVLDAEAEQNANKELLDFDANEIEDAQFEEVKSVDGFIDVTEVETSPANESESEEDPF